MINSGMKKQLITTVSSYFGGGTSHSTILSEDIRTENNQMMIKIGIAFRDVTVIW